jgi:Putative Actinobacterial Holin-X, holin superfamily III
MSLQDDMNAIPKLLGDAIEQLGKLIQNEIQLARAEVSQKITRAGIGAAYVSGAAILCVPVLVVLLIALALWLTELGLSPALAYLAAGGCGALICAILAMVGLSYLKPEGLKPKITMQQIERDAAAAKELAR